MCKCTSLFHELDQAEERYLRLWQDICAIESPTNHKEGLDRVVNRLAEEAQRAGLEIQIIPQAKAGDMIQITLNNHSAKKPILLSAHIDTVHPIGSFGDPPVREENGILYGPGVMDDKGGAAASLYAMEALQQCGYTERNVIFLAQTDEEVSSATSDLATIRYMCEVAKGCEFFLNCEPFHKGEAILRRKGIAQYRFHVKGKSAHSARCYAGANALLEAAHKIIEIESYKDGESITCNCSLISGGDVANSVPDWCDFTVDVRYFTAEQFERIEARLREIADTSYIGNTECVMACVNQRPAMELTERNQALLATMNRIYAACGMETLSIGTSFGGSDAANVSATGIPTVDSIGCEGGMLHTPEEFAYVRSLKESAKRIASVICFYDEMA